MSINEIYGKDLFFVKSIHKKNYNFLKQLWFIKGLLCAEHLLVTLLHALSPVIVALLLASADIISVFHLKKLGCREESSK